ncbi:MAG: hypothetical protein H6564_00835 [Lewinellaceae bacterium]|nr:hypothetical protein [Lewinellaceae bacterium]
MTRLSVFVAFAITFYSCTKDKDAICPPPGKQCGDSTLYASLLPADTCVVFPEITSGILYIYQRVGLGYGLIGKSSSNSDEWLYLINREVSSTGLLGSEIWKIDTCSGRKEMIIDSVHVQPKYNSKGWLLILSTRDALLYRLKENGDSLKIVSDQIAHDLFDWCLDGEAFFYRARFKEVAYLVSIEGEVLDSFALDCHAIAGRANRIALSLESPLSTTHSRIGILDLNNGELTEVVELRDVGLGGPQALTWESDKTLIGAFPRGLYRIHIPTGEVEAIKETCDNLFYFYPSMGPDDNSWLFLGRRDYMYPQLLNVDFTISMVMLNTQTGEEWKLDLDQ